MGSKKSKAPAAPDYTKLAQEQARQSEQAAIRQAELQNQYIQLQTEANRPNQITPYGEIAWKKDPTTGQWTQTETWNPEIKAAYDQQMALNSANMSAQEKQLQQLNELINRGSFSGPEITAKFDQDYADRYTNQMLGQLTARMKPQYQQDQQAMDTKLRLQGLQAGTEAYDRAYKNLLTSQGDVMEQANLSAQLAGGQEARSQFQTELQSQQAAYDRAMKEYLLPWDTYASTVGAQRSNYQPQYQGFNQAGAANVQQMQAADIMGAAQQQYAQQMQAYNEAKEKKSSKGSSIGSIAGAIGGSFFGMPQVGAMAGGAIGGQFSDPALKEDIETIDDEICYNIMMKMLPVSWTWSGTSARDAGLNAKQVLELAPELCERGAKGLLMVNYSKFNAYLLGAFRHLAKLESNREPANRTDGT